MAITSGWYNDSDYSDLTLKLKDDREIKVHKVVICKSNEFFRGLCGVGSGFAESSQKTISLKSDDPDAVEEVLRKIYGCALEKYNQRPWEFWFNLVITADKYLEPKLSAKASERLRASALALTDGDAIFDLITTIQRDMGHLEPFLQFADQIRKDNLKTLLDNEKYRALLDGDKTLLWSHLDELKAAAGLSEPSDSSGKSDLPDLSSFVERTYSFCHKHDPPVCINDTQHSQHMWCFRCRDQVQCEQHKVWLPK